MSKRWGLLFLTVLLAPTLVLGQAETGGKVSGTVVDQDGHALSGVRITLSSPALMGERTVTTDEGGKFVAPFLPPGAYLLDVAAPGQQSAQYTMRIGVGQDVPLDIVLKEGAGMVETVHVYGTMSKLETTAGGENFDSREIDQLPVTNRGIERIAELAPNISFGPTPNTLSIAGAPSFDTVVLLDGAEVSDPYFGSAPDVYLEEAVEEVQVLTTGVSARYGRFQGGVINAVTKSGGNTFDGSARIDLSREDWNQTSPAREERSDNLDKVYSATVGGPILKNHLWFFVGGRTIPTDSTTNQTALSGESFTTSRDEDRYQIKLSGAPAADHTIDLSYLNFDATSTGRAGLPAGDLRAATGKRNDPREIYTGEYQGILSDHLFLNVQATQKRVSIESGASDLSLGSPFLDYYGGGFQIWHDHWWDINDPSVRDNDTASVALTQVLSTGSWGDHSIEYGISYVNSTTGGENRQSATGFNLLNYDALVSGNEFSNVNEAGFDPSDPMFNLISYYDAAVGFTYRWIALPLGGDQKLKNTAAYVQDTWEYGKWRVDAGLRWEKYDGSGPNPTFDMNFDKLVPRVAVGYNIDQNWQLQASWGRYVARFNDNVASSVTGVSGAPYVVQLYTGPTMCALGTHCLSYDDVEAALRDDANWDITTTITDTNQPTRALGKDINAPYADDFNLSVKRALPRNTGTLTVTYTNRQYRDLLTDFIGQNAHPELPAGEATVTVTDPLGSAVTNTLDKTIWDNSSLAARDYTAVTATWDYRPSARWNIGGNWTYSTTRGNYEGEGRNTPSSGSIIGTYPKSVNEQAAIPYGYLSDDIRHRVRAWGSYTFDFGRPGSLTLGSVGTYQSGLPFSKSGSQPFMDNVTYLNDQGTYTYFTDGRGSHRFGGFWKLDLTTRYDVAFRKDFGGYVKFSITNLTNNDDATAFNTSGSVVANAAGQLEFQPGGSFGLPRSNADYQLPRQYWVSVGITF